MDKKVLVIGNCQISTAEKYLEDIAALIASQDFGSALKLISLALTHYPEHLWLKTNMAQIFVQKAEWKRALEVGLDLLSDHADHAVAYDIVALCYENLGNYAEAKIISEKGVSKCPEIFWLWLRYARLIELTKDIDESISVWKSIFVKFPDEVGPVVRILELLVRTGDLDAAYDFSVSASNNFKDNLYIYLTNLELALKLKKYSYFYNKWKVIDDNSDFAYRNYILAWNYFVIKPDESGINKFIDALLNENVRNPDLDLPAIIRQMNPMPGTVQTNYLFDKIIDRIKSRSKGRNLTLLEMAVWCSCAQPLTEAQAKENLKFCIDNPSNIIDRILLENWKVLGREGDYIRPLSDVVDEIKSGSNFDFAKIVKVLKISSTVSGEIFEDLLMNSSKIIGNNDGVYCVAIQNMAQKKINFITQRSRKIAVCVSGQLRGFKAARQSWGRFSLPDNFEIDYFVHVWSKIGSKPPEYAYGHRCFYNHLSSAYSEAISRIGLSEVKLRYKNLLSFFDGQDAIDEGDLHEVYQPKLMCVDKDEDFESFSNPWKMHYKIKKCFELASNFSEYSHFIRIRPDKAIDFIDGGKIHNMLDEASDNPYLYLDEKLSYMCNAGYFVGDQFALSDQWGMERYAATFDIIEREKIKPTLGGMITQHTPHASIAHALLYQGVRAKLVDGIGFGSLQNPEKMKPQEALSRLELDTALGCDDVDNLLLKAAKSDLMNASTQQSV